MAHLGNTVVNGALRVIGGENVDTINGVTVGASPKFTDTNNAVTQTATTTDAKYEILFSATADNTTRTEGARKTTSLRFNPSKGALMEGYDTVATGNYSHAEGNRTTASGNYSHAEGIKSYAKSEDAHAEGQATSAVYLYAHAEGSHTCAASDSAHAEGSATTASGSYSHTEGRLTYTTVPAISAHAEGHRTTASGKGAHAEGGYTTAEIGGTKASGENAHAEGFLTTASANYSHAEGQSTNAAKRCAHAEGYGTTASGQSSHAEGYNTLVVTELYDSMYGSHAEGYQTTCGNDGSGKHAEGFKTSAYGTGSHSEGVSTVANGNQGAHAEGDSTTASGLGSHAEGGQTIAAGKYSHTEGYLTWTSPTADGAHAEGGYPASGGDGGTTANGLNAHAEGFKTVANGASAHAEGNYTTAGSSGHAEGRYTQAGSGAHAEGDYSTASGENSHAEGHFTAALSQNSHAEGAGTRATNQMAHAEGDFTTASGLGSHAEGSNTVASGNYSHASGQGTSAGGACQTVIGKYNVADTSSAFIIGNGTSASAKSNAFKVDFSGNFDAGNFKSEHSGYYGYTDLNSLPCSGYYWGRQNVPSVAAGSLAPDNTCGAITWKYNELFEDQIAMDSYNSGALFTRSKTNGAWSTWKKVKMSDDQYVCSGVEYDPSREQVTKVTASDGWNSQIYSKRGYKNNVYVRFKAGQTNKAIMVGLNSDPTTDANYASIDFCWYLQNNGTLMIYESGTGYNTINSGTNVTYVTGEEFYIEVHDNKVYYYRNNDYYSEPKLERVSTNKTTSSSSNFNKLYFDSSFHGQSGFIYDVEFGVTTQTASRILVNNEAGQGLLNNFPIAVSRNIVSSTSGMQHTTLQTFPYFSYCPPYHSLSVGEGASASKFEAFALGYNVEANANSSFATGEGTVAVGECQTVIGKYNISDSTDLLIIGNGSSNTSRSNALNIGANAVIYPKNGIQYSASSAGPNLSNNWISCGAGYSTGSGKNGLKLLSCEQADCYSGLGQDCGGGPWELSIVAGATNANIASNGQIRFLKHGNEGTGLSTYTQLARLAPDGKFMCASVVPGGSDYAEFFEWNDENPNEEDRVGYFVTFDNENKIRIANTNDEYILGVTSANPCVLGNGDKIDANEMCLRDEFGRLIYEEVPEMEVVSGGSSIPKLDKNGNIIYIKQPKLNPDYKPSKPDESRFDKPEWCPVGMLGVLIIRDDGTCTVNSYATVGMGGIATKAEANSLFKYRVIKRRTNNIIEIIFR